MPRIEPDFILQKHCETCLQLHAKIISDLYQQLEDSDTVRSHYFQGRFENIYIDEEKIRGLDVILNAIKMQAAEVLQAGIADLKLGFWFNMMQQGDVTLPHSHDDDDELLSGTYYLQVPEGSANLLIHHPRGTTQVTPVEGQMVFFHPSLEHEVSQHQAASARISIGFNLGKPRA